MSPSDRAASLSLQTHEPFRFVKKREISKLTGLSGDTLKKYRLSGLLCEDNCSLTKRSGSGSVAGIGKAQSM
jgi:hypothetical protein